jgi:uncharacterized protein YqgC (DUF456 family)
MKIALVILSFVLHLAGLLGTVIPVLPGPPLSFIALLVMQWSGYGGFSPAFLWLWGGITVAVVVMDYFLPSLMTKQFGGSRAAAIGSFVGLLAGMFIFPPWGIIIGSFFGAFIGELIHDRANAAKDGAANSGGAKAFKVAVGSFLAFIVGSGAKLIACSMMLFYAIKALV